MLRTSFSAMHKNLNVLGVAGLEISSMSKMAQQNNLKFGYSPCLCDWIMERKVSSEDENKASSGIETVEEDQKQECMGGTKRKDEKWGMKEIKHWFSD